MDELKTYLINQQYPYKVVEDGIKKASEVDREELINPKPRNENNTQILPLVTTYNPRNKNITPIVRQLNNILKTDDNMSRAMLNVKFINSKRQPKSLRILLCASKMTTSQKSVTKCNEIFLFFSSFYYIIRKQFIKWKHLKLSMSAYINMLTELNFSLLWNMNVLFVDTDSGSQTGTCLSDIKFVAAHAGNNIN